MEDTLIRKECNENITCEKGRAHYFDHHLRHIRGHPHFDGYPVGRSVPASPKPFFNKNGNPLAGSISEKVFVNINGMEQGMFIKSKNIKNPVLLYLHGGMPDYFLTQNYPIDLEDYFTVVWWEQRGSGISYQR